MTEPLQTSPGHSIQHCKILPQYSSSLGALEIRQLDIFQLDTSIKSRENMNIHVWNIVCPNGIPSLGAINFKSYFWQNTTRNVWKRHHHQSESRSCWVNSLPSTAKINQHFIFVEGQFRSNSIKPNGSLLRSPLVVEVMQACRVRSSRLRMLNMLRDGWCLSSRITVSFANSIVNPSLPPSIS